jgi:hypothetical protein
MEKDGPTEEIGCDKSSTGHAAVEEVYVDPILEKRALRKFDWILMPQIMLLLIFAMLDRSNIG